MKIKFTLNELSFISLRYQMLTNSSRGPAFNVLAFPSSCTEKLESFGADGFCLVSESESREGERTRNEREEKVREQERDRASERESERAGERDSKR